MSASFLTAELVVQIAGLAGLELAPERAADLLPSLHPIFEGDAVIMALKLGTLRPLGSSWPEEFRE